MAFEHPKPESKASTGAFGPSLVVLLAVWFVAARLVDSRALPGPEDVASFLVHEAIAGPLFSELGVTLLRVAVSFAISMVIGSALGILLGLFPAVNLFFDPWLTVLLNIPAVVFIVLAYIWLGLNETAAICAVVLNKFPNVAVTLREGACALDTSYSDMATVFRFSRLKTLKHVILPQLEPFFAAATRSGIALIWKIVLVVELLGRSNGVGFEIHLHFQMFDLSAILGYTIAFAVVILAIEFWAVKPMERRSRRWRGRHA